MFFYNFFRNIIQFFLPRKKIIMNNDSRNKKNLKTKKLSKENKDNVNEDIYPLF